MECCRSATLQGSNAAAPGIAVVFKMCALMKTGIKDPGNVDIWRSIVKLNDKERAVYPSRHSDKLKMNGVKVVGWSLLVCALVSSAPASSSDVTADELEKAKEFGLGGFTLFVSANWSVKDSPLVDNCGATEKTACTDFIELMRRYCQLTRNTSTTDQEVRPLTLHLLPGVHSVNIPLLKRFTIQTGSICVAEKCHLSDCPGRIRLFGHAVAKSVVLFKSDKTAGSSCGNDWGSVSELKLPPWTKRDLEMGWLFMAFIGLLELRLANLTLKSVFAHSTPHQFFYVESIGEFSMEDCDFPALGPANSALMIALLGQNVAISSARYHYQIAGCKFTLGVHRSENGVRRSAIRILDTVNQSRIKAHPSAVELTKSTFSLACRYTDPSEVERLPMDSLQRSDDVFGPSIIISFPLRYRSS